LARIAGVDLPKDKRIEVGLTYIFGIGGTTAKRVLERAEVDGDVRVKDLTDEQTNSLRKLIEQDLKVEGDLRQEIAMNIKRLKDIGSYRGMRHRRHLPLRGQRTKTNSRTLKGSKPGIGIKKKPKKS